MSLILLKLPPKKNIFNPFPGIGGILVGTAIRDFLAGIPPNTWHYYFHSRTKTNEWDRTVKHIVADLGFMKSNDYSGNGRGIAFIGNEGRIIIEKVTNNFFYPEKLVENVTFTIDQFAARGPDILTTKDAVEDLKHRRINITKYFQRNFGNQSKTIHDALKELERKGFVFDEQYFAYIMAKKSPYGI
jgi:hypothetical protein